MVACRTSARLSTQRTNRGRVALSFLHQATTAAVAKQSPVRVPPLPIDGKTFFLSFYTGWTLCRPVQWARRWAEWPTCCWAIRPLPPSSAFRASASRWNLRSLSPLLSPRSTHREFGQAVNASALSPVAAPLPPVAATPSLATDLQILNTVRPNCPSSVLTGSVRSSRQPSLRMRCLQDFRRWVEGQLSNKGMQVDLSPVRCDLHALLLLLLLVTMCQQGLRDYLAHATKLGLTTPAAGAAAGDDTVQDDSETMETECGAEAAAEEVQETADGEGDEYESAKLAAFEALSEDRKQDVDSNLQGFLSRLKSGERQCSCPCSCPCSFPCPMDGRCWCTIGCVLRRVCGPCERRRAGGGHGRAHQEHHTGGGRAVTSGDERWWWGQAPVSAGWAL